MAVTTKREIENLVVLMQNAFLETPRLALTLPIARKRFGVDAATCAAVLDLLAEANVLNKNAKGLYMRHVPQRAGVTSLRASRQSGSPRRLASRAA